VAENTNIQWTDHTFNPWRGCTKVSDGCKFCYAEKLSERNHATLGVWGPSGSRPVGSESYWKAPLKWNREAQEAGERRRVFCASLADVFEGEETMPASAVAPVTAARRRLFETIDATPHLDWLLLTKRPENIERLWPFGWYDGRFTWPNLWLGTSVEDQAAADRRIPELLKVPAAVRFLSCEPLLGPVDLDLSYPCPTCGGRGGGLNFGPASMDDGAWDCGRCEGTGAIPFGNIPEWVIVGGESGPNARACDLRWVRDIVAQCRRAGVPVFVKQLGSVPVMDEAEWRALGTSPMLNAANHAKAPASTVPILMRDRKGGDMAEWPADLRVREFPSPITVAERVVA
jgi:protein gp37